MSEATKIKVDVPDGESGDWKVERFTVSDEDIKLHNLRCSFKAGMGGRVMESGTYTKITRNGKVIMSDTPAEIRDHMEFIYQARKRGGHVLINGLGLGWALEAILDAPKIKTITVIEKSPDVIDLVGQHYKDKCPKNKYLLIIHADALEWKPPKGNHYEAVWHDIWDNICSDNLPDMHKLHRKYGRRCDWQGSWCRYQCEQANRRY